MNTELVDILKDELIPAMGCTEPIAIAFASATARDLLGKIPEKITVRCSGNIIKNVKGVIVPGTEKMRGIDTSAVLGIFGGKAELTLEVLSEVNQDDLNKTVEYLKKNACTIELVENEENLYIDVILEACSESAEVVIAGGHTNIVKKVKNGETIFEKKWDNQKILFSITDLSLTQIFDFANEVEIKDIQNLLDRQIAYNRAISEEGIKHKYGANVGSTLLRFGGANIENVAKAYAAAGSDARMGGCELPVVINSGSGNQGITVSVPIIKYAEYANPSSETVYRALTFGNLVAIYIKKGIGKLSAFCGVVSAACGAIAGISYILGDSLTTICGTLTNTLGNVSGMICDGAKSSCAAKIVTALESAFLGRNMSINGEVFQNGEGLTCGNIEDTIKNIWDLGKCGMKQTDIEILNLMIGRN